MEFKTQVAFKHWCNTEYPTERGFAVKANAQYAEVQGPDGFLFEIKDNEHISAIWASILEAHRSDSLENAKSSIKSVYDFVAAAYEDNVPDPTGEIISITKQHA